MTATRTHRKRRKRAVQQPRKPLDPTQVRVSKYFMLSDFMGCNSVYSRGLCNRIYSNEPHKLEQGYRLGFYLDRLVESFGVVAVSYGFISGALSQQIVKYQDPNKPSFHRWDLGAACDIRIMDIDWRQVSTLELASDICEEFQDTDFARMITYSESPWICFATSMDDEQNTRRVYENRFTGTPKARPVFHHWKGKEDALAELVLHRGAEDVLGDWIGAGYPTYHGGGTQQYHHIKLSFRVNLSDLLYSRDFVFIGKHNRPPEDLNHFRRAAAFLEDLYDSIHYRVSIVGGYENQEHEDADPERSFENGFYLELVPPEGTDSNTFIDILKSISRFNVQVKADDSNITKFHVRG